MRRWCRARTSLRRSLHVFVVYVVAAGFLYRSLHTLQSAATRSRPTPPGMWHPAQRLPQPASSNGYQPPLAANSANSALQSLVSSALKGPGVINMVCLMRGSSIATGAAVVRLTNDPYSDSPLPFRLRWSPIRVSPIPIHKWFHAHVTSACLNSPPTGHFVPCEGNLCRHDSLAAMRDLARIRRSIL